MAIGEHKGKTTQQARTALKKELIAKGDVLNYAETSRKVISRAGDECVVARIDEWCVDYGESEWKQQTHEYVGHK